MVYLCQQEGRRFYLGPEGNRYIDVMVPGSFECFNYVSEVSSKCFKNEDERGGIRG